MSCKTDFKEWLTAVRYSRNVCMLIPMEACMGHPIVVKQGVEYIVPFFKVSSVENTDKLTAPFAYLRISYPSVTILTYNSLYTLPEWRETDWNEICEASVNSVSASKIEDYYRSVSCGESSECSAEQQDELLLECLLSQSGGSNDSYPPALWYQKLIAEAKKYR